MSGTQTRMTVPATEVRVGDTLHARGLELEVTRIDTVFLGRDDFLAFVEDTARQWLKIPSPRDAEVEISRRSR